MGKKKMIILTSVILSVVVIALGIVKLYQTYALGTYIDASSSATYDILINENTSVKVPGNSYSNVFYMVKNTSPGSVTYGVGYETDSNIKVKIFSTSKDPAIGIVEENGRKYVKLRIENSSSSSKEVKLSTVLGYSGDSDLIVPDGITLVTEVWSTKGNFATYISNLYDDASKTTVTNNSITYNYAASESLMNDRLGGTTTDYNGGNIRYYGASPNNYVYFNCSSYPSTTCEVWRIIGVFDGKVKLMRNESIGSYPWDNKNTTTGAEEDEGSNNWSTARIMKLLNPNNYFTVDSFDNNVGQSLYYNALNGECFSGTDNGTASCNFSSTGLKTKITRNMISTQLYYLGGTDSSNIYANQMYSYERTGTNVYGSNPANWIGKVALPYASDYGYAADLSKCTQTLNSYGSTICRNNNWMYSVTDGDDSWLLTHNYDYGSSIVLYISGGYILDDDGLAFNDFENFPSLYLNPNIELIGGTGTSNDPYQLSDNFIEKKNIISTYTISYDANGGTGAPSSQNKIQNIELTLSSTTPTRSGYQFVGWNTEADGSGTSYQAGASFYENNNVTLYAQWKKIINISYDANGGTGASSSQTKLSGESLTLSSTKPTRTGYTFYKWNTSSSGNGTYYSAGGTYSGDTDVTLYAVWTINQYTLKLTKGTGVSTIYYKINGASSYSSTTSDSISLDVNYNSTYYYYGTASTGYTTSTCTSTNPCSGTMGIISVTKQLTAAANKYNLILTPSTGVSTIYYKINGASSYSSSTSSKTLTVNYGSTYYYYITASTGYTASTCTSTNPCSGIMVASNKSITLTATANKYGLILSPGTGVDTIYYKINGASSYSSSTSVKTISLDVNYGSTYYYYGVASTGYTMTSCTQSNPCSGTMGTSSVTKQLTARINVVNIQYSTNGGTLVATSVNYSQDNSTSLVKNSSGSTILQSINYGGSLDNNGLLDYNSQYNLSISKSGNIADVAAEWKCTSGCTTSNKTFNMMDSYNASDFCDASSADCTVTLSVNWTSSYTSIEDYRCNKNNTTDYHRITNCNSTKCHYMTKNGFGEWGYIDRSNLTTCYIVEFYSNGGTFNNSTGRGDSTVYYRRDLSLNTNYYFSNLGIPTLTRSGCTFNGWYFPDKDKTYSSYFAIENTYYTVAKASWSC